MGVIGLLALSTSVDSLGIGMSFALSGIRIPWTTKIMIALSGGVLTLLSVIAGAYFGQFVNSFWFCLAGGGILVCLGIKAIWGVWKSSPPAEYDKDGSKVLDVREGVVIGVSLALDSMSAGFCISYAGAGKYAYPVLTAFLNAVFLTAGNYICCNSRVVNFFGGALLAGLGLYRLFAGC